MFNTEENGLRSLKNKMMKSHITSVMLVMGLIMAMCSVAFGAGIYVNPASVDDTGDGSTANAGTGGTSAFRTVAAAIDAAGAGDTIKLVAGDYTESTQTWCVSLPKKSFTIEPEAVEKVTLTRTTYIGAGWFNVEADNTYVRHVFNNIRFVDNKDGGSILMYQANLGGNVEFNRCSFDMQTDGQIIKATSKAAFGQERRVRIVNCDVVPKAYTASLLDMVNMHSVHVEGGTIASANTTGTKFLISNTYAYGDTYIKDVAFTGKFGVEVRYVEATQRTPYSVRITGCSFTSTDPFKGRAIELDYNWHNGPPVIIGADITHNYMYGYDIGVFGSMSDSNISYNVVDCLDGMIMYGGIRNKIVNNTIKARDFGGKTARCLLFNRRNYSSEIADSEPSNFETATVTSAGWDLSCVPVDGSVMVFVKRQSGSRPLSYYGVVKSVDDDLDTVTVERWVRVSDGATATPANNTFFVQCGRFAEQNYVENNIMDGALSSYVFSFDFNPLDGRNYIDYNCYNIQAGKALSNLGCVAQRSLAKTQGKWLAWPENITLGRFSTSKYNDAHSIEADPGFVDAANHDYRLLGNSPCKNAGKPTLGGGYTSIGAYQFKQPGDSNANCVRPLESDVNGDCRVDLADFAVMCSQWLADGTK
ncbi:MAG: hypothetical protein IH624_12440 [Phycisphaerae bacterium]|nr:hypothetical protein [Phycisphaerae bacterium]